MTPLRSAWSEYLGAFALFSPQARRFLSATFLAWSGHGVSQVLFNLYLVAGGHREGFVGQAIALNGLGLALMALPAGMLADRWGRVRCLTLGVVLEGAGLLVRALPLDEPGILVASFASGMGQSLFAIAAAPFITEHSGARERTHLFSSFFAVELLAGVAGSMLGGALPKGLLLLPEPWRPELMIAYRWTLVLGAGLALVAAFPLAAIGGAREAAARRAAAARPGTPAERRLLVPIALNAFLIGSGAGLVIPFMNLYFATRFDCSSAQIGVFFSLAQISTAIAALLGPALARVFGRLRTAIAFQVLSLPFLVTLGAERHLEIAVLAFWMRATLMQASTPLVQSFIMEALPPALRARSASVNNTVWNTGWAVSSIGSGWMIQSFGYAVPFYVTATLYAAAATIFYLSFRRIAADGGTPSLSEEAKGTRGEGPFTE